MGKDIGREEHKPISARVSRFLVPVLLAVFFLQCVGSLSYKSPTVDEVLYIPAGYVFWHNGSIQPNPETQPLPRILSGLPLQFLPIKNEVIPAFKDRYHWGSHFLFEVNRDIAGKIIFWARIPNIILGLCLLVIVYLWSKELFGHAGGLLSLAFAALSPNLVAHSSLATTDLPLCAFFFFALYAFHRYLQNPSRFRLVPLTGVLLGMLLLCKSSAWLIMPVMIAMAGKKNLSAGPDRIQWKQLLRDVAVMAAVALLVIQLPFHFRGFLQDKGDAIHSMLGEKGFAGWGLRLFLLPFPKEYCLSFLFNIAQSSGKYRPFVMFINGQYSQTGFWYFFFEALCIKTPLGLLSSVLLALGFAFRLKRDRMVLLLPWIFFLMYFSFFNKLDLGLRYVLPVYPFWFVLVGSLPSILPVRLKNIIPVAFAGWNLVAAILIYPYHLAYFNELVGGPRNGYKYLVDSDLDWGQDLPALKSYMQQHDIDRIALSYFGMADPAFYGISYDYLPSPPNQPWTIRHRGNDTFALRRGLYAISAGNLQGLMLPDRNQYAVFRNREPVATIGYSILIFTYP